MSTIASLRRQLRALADQEHAAVLERLRATSFFQELGEADRAQVLEQATNAAARRFHLRDQVRRRREDERRALSVGVRRRERWLHAVYEAADLTRELSGAGHDIDPDLFRGPRFNALRTLLGTKKATVQHRARGKESLKRVKDEASELMKRNQHLSRRAMARVIGPIVGRSTEHTEDMLEQLELPRPRRQK